MSRPLPRKTLVLHIEVPDVYADDLEESAAAWADDEPPTAEDYLNVVTEEWMRPEVGLTVVTIPGEKNTNDDFEVHAYIARIVGAELRDRKDPDA
jgi:hypothetical protein